MPSLCRQIYVYIATGDLVVQEKCIQYWPALMDTPWNVSSNLSVTLQVQTQYAAFRVKNIIVENVRFHAVHATL